MARKVKELPRGWRYTGKTLCDNLAETGILHHYYCEPSSKSIYQVTKIKRKRGGKHPLMELSDSIKIRVRFVNPEDPSRIKSAQINKYIPPQKTENFHLEDAFYDKEVKQITNYKR